MPKPAPTVLLGLEYESDVGPFLRLDDPVWGKLDTEGNILGGTILFDVTNYVRSITTNRGKSNSFASFPSGETVVQFNNHDRTFDPLFTSSPFTGNIVPRRELKIVADDSLVFSGWVEDWNLRYLPSGDSIAEAVAIDAFTFLANEFLPALTTEVERSGTRVNKVLDAINWASELRDIDPGSSFVGNYDIAEDTSALEYLNDVSFTEPASLFVGKDGKITYRDNATAPSSSGLVEFAKNGTGGVPFRNLDVNYGSERLFNTVAIGRLNGATAISVSQESVQQFGARSLQFSDLLFVDDAQAQNLADFYANFYAFPEYRFAALEVDLTQINADQTEDVLAIELGDTVKISFTPNNIPPEIVRFVQVIGIDHEINKTTHTIVFKFRSLDASVFVLDDLAFGILGQGRLGY